VDLINRGKVYRFMMKPVTPGRARLAVEAAVKHHLEAPDSAFKGAEDTSADVNVADAQQTKEAALEISEPAVSDAFGSEQVDEAPATVDEQAPSHTETAPAEDTETAAVPDVGTGSLRATQSIKTSERMQKLAAARLESRAATSAHFPKLIAIGAAAIVIVAGAWLWLSGGDVEETTPVETIATPPSVAESDVVIDDPVDEVPAIDMDALLASPRAARQAGAIFEPAESNAIDLYQAAVLESEGDPLAVAEFDAVISEALTFAETALIESRLDDAELALQRIADVDADNVRLPFLSAQLQQARMFEILSEARAAIRDSRLQDAAGFLETAEALSVTDRTEIDAVASELDLARKAQRTDEVLALADARLEAGDLLVPANRNARHYYELVLSNDSHNKAARQGLKVIAGRLVLEARTSIDNGDFANAEMLLGEVEILDPQNGQLLATAEALRASRESAEAERAAAELRAQSELETSDDLPTEATLQATPAVATVPVDEGTSSDAGSFNAEPVAVSSLIRTRYVAPKYPRSAQRRNLSGWVDISFTVDVDGTVKDVAVRESEPGTTFDDAAMRAVEKWEFEPVLYDGAAIEQRVAVRMMFALE
jgi:protein TonB